MSIKKRRLDRSGTLEKFCFLKWLVQLTLAHFSTQINSGRTKRSLREIVMDSVNNSCFEVAKKKSSGHRVADQFGKGGKVNAGRPCFPANL